MENVSEVIKNGVCLSCGLCEGVCPVKCIGINEDNKTILPAIDETRCVSCGLCQKICPGRSANYMVQNIKLAQVMKGSVISSYVGRCTEKNILMNSVSGGVLTCLINRLLVTGVYDSAIGVKSRQFNCKCEMDLYDRKNISPQFQKSVYTMPSYSKVIQYIKKNRNEKVIIVGTGCIINSIQKWMKSEKINVKQHLFLGLFCDATLNHTVEKYFSGYSFLSGSQITGVEYRSKSGGSYWPGDVKLKLKNKEVSVPREERFRIVEYFKNERCLYCLNHMNVQADISFGDNYTGKYSDKLGSNTVVVRTEKGRTCLGRISDKTRLYEIPYAEILKSQGIEKKILNYYFSELFEKRTGICINEGVSGNAGTRKNSEKIISYRKRLKKVSCGKRYGEHPILISLFLISRGKSRIRNRINVWKEIRKKE